MTASDRCRRSVRRRELRLKKRLALAFQAYLKAQDASRAYVSDRFRYKFSPISRTEIGAEFSYAWFEDHFHPIEFLEIESDNYRWLIRHSPIERLGSRSVSNQLEDWLTSDGRFGSFRWYSAEEWNGAKRWQETPW